jgi:subtilisin-like proprotein convertase family protein
VSTPNAPIPDVASVSDMLAVSGLGMQTAEVRLKTFITHTYGADLEMTLISPQGTVVDFSFDNGGANDDVFNGTVWYDSARSVAGDYAASNYVYANLVTAPQLAPDGEFQRFWYEDPNGAWTLSVNDDAAADIGNLAQWELEITTWDAGSSVPTSYCTSGPTRKKSAEADCTAALCGAVTPSESRTANISGRRKSLAWSMSIRPPPSTLPGSSNCPLR